MITILSINDISATSTTIYSHPKPTVAIVRPYGPHPLDPKYSPNNALWFQTYGEQTVALSGESDEATVSNLARGQKLNRYIGLLRDQNEISQTTAQYAWQAWMHINEEMGRSLQVPAAAAGPNKELLYTWNNGDHHFELEIYSDGSADLFYANRRLGNLWDQEYNANEPLSQEAKEKLEFFI